MTEPVFIALINPKSGGKVGPELLERYSYFKLIIWYEINKIY